MRMDHYILPEGDGVDQGDYEEPSQGFTEPAETTPPPDSGGAPALPQTSGSDPWVAVAFFVVALLAIVGGIVMRRRIGVLNSRHRERSSDRW